MAADPGGAESGQLIEREIAASPAEFTREFLCAFPEATQAGPGRLRVDQPAAAHLEIELQPGQPRRLGALTLPTLHVRIRLYGSAAARAALLAHMDRAMQRGGG